MRNSIKKLIALVAIVGAAGAASAADEPGAAIITACQAALTGTMGLLLITAAAIIAAGLGLWAAPFVAKKVKRWVSAAS